MITRPGSVMRSKAAFDAIKQLAPNGGKVLVTSTDPDISATLRPVTTGHSDHPRHR